jgi:hypothetical protein
MARVFTTGKGLVLTIGGTTYTDVASSVMLAETINRATLEPLSGQTDVYISTDATLTVDLYQDWNSSGSGTLSVCNALYEAAASAPNTSLAFVFTTATSGKVFSGSVYPEKPNVGGASTDALTASLTFKVVGGTVTKA